MISYHIERALTDLLKAHGIEPNVEAVHAASYVIADHYDPPED